MLTAIIGSKTVPLLYDSGEDIFGIGISNCPFPREYGCHECNFDIEDSNFFTHIERVEVYYITRRHVYFARKAPEEEYEEDNSQAELSQESGETESQESCSRSFCTYSGQEAVNESEESLYGE